MYWQEGGSSRAENGDQAQAHTGIIPAVLGTFTKHVPYPLAGAIGAVREVAKVHFPPDHYWKEGCSEQRTLMTEVGEGSSPDQPPGAGFVVFPTT